MLAQRDGYLANLEMIGMARDGSAAWITWPAVVVTIKATHIFNQTPGADAGRADRMSVTLESLATCLQGILPAQLFTCSRDGIPNAAYLSHVDYVDSTHVALSFQFFNKSRRNIAENPHALVIVLDPDTGQGWQLRLRYERSETEGPLFDRMALRIEAIASVLRTEGHLQAARGGHLRSARRSSRCRKKPASRRRRDRDRTRLGAPDPVFTMKALQDLAGRIQRADCLEGLVDSILAGLEESFGFKYSMILVPAEEPGTLVTIATRGYPHNGAGAEMRYGDGIGGMVAEARKPIRISGLMRGMLYAYAMHLEAHGSGAGGRVAIAFRYRASSTPRACWACRSSSATSWSACCASRARCRIGFTKRTRPRSSCSATISRLRFRTCSCASSSPTRTRQGDDTSAVPAAAGRRRPRAARDRLLRRRRVHHDRRRVPDPQPAGEDPLEAATPTTRLAAPSSPIASFDSTSR